MSKVTGEYGRSPYSLACPPVTEQGYLSIAVGQIVIICKDRQRFHSILYGFT
jgi:hypothetical protein